MPTRARVAQSILVNGPSTAAALAERLELTPAAVRRHLDQLLAEGAVDARDPRPVGSRGRGRPAKVFALTERGRDAFDQQYDDLATEALRFLAETVGEDAVRAFAERRAEFIEQRFPEVQRQHPDASPAEVLALVFTDEGYAASVREVPGQLSVRVFDQTLHRHAGRRGLEDLRGLVSVLRGPDGSDAEALPDLDRLGALCAHMRDSGLHVRLDRSGDLDVLPADELGAPVEQGGAQHDLVGRHPGHADRGAAVDPRPRALRADQPRPAAPHTAARARAVARLPSLPALRRRRRVPRLPGDLRLARRAAAAAAGGCGA